MKKAILQLILLLSLVVLCVGGFLLGKYCLNLPFRAANDALHEKDALLTLDFLIPGGTYIDQKATIGEVIKLRVRDAPPFYESALAAFMGFIPVPYRHVANLLVFFFFCFSFMAFFRVFTFMGYGRALRISLVLAGMVYFFLPDFSPGRQDDILLIGLPVLIVLIRMYYAGRKKERRFAR